MFRRFRISNVAGLRAEQFSLAFSKFPPTDPVVSFLTSKRVCRDFSVAKVKGRMYNMRESGTVQWQNPDFSCDSNLDQHGQVPGPRSTQNKSGIKVDLLDGLLS